ncbi:MAG: M48 family metallopeptidase [Bacteroidia bacterium]|nr:M48 family metallopeptidase [Bacteroidia bacterium]
MKKTLLTTAMVAGLFLSCQKNLVTGKRSFNIVPDSEMLPMSFSEYDKFLAEHPPLPVNDSRVILVKRVGERIQKAVEDFYASKNASKELASFSWAFNVVDDQTVNAWCMPGGKVVVYTGLLPVTQDEQSLAVVMGHEIAHAIAKHGAQRMSAGMALQFGTSAISAGMSKNPTLTKQIFSQSVGMVGGLGMLKYSRKHETEADEMGLIFAAMAGYDPEAAVAFWQRMASSGGQKPPEILSTHPSDETRINNLKAFMPQAKKYFKAQ